MAESSAFYETLFDSINDMILVHEFSAHGPPGRFTLVNEAACRLLGYTREELLQLSPLDIMSVEDMKDVPSEAAELAGCGDLLFRKTLVTRSGDRIMAEINTHVVEFDGRPIAFSIARDITTHVQAEAALCRSEARLQEAQRIAKIGSWEWNTQTNESIESAEVYAIFGITSPRSGLGHRGFMRVVHPDDTTRVESAIEAALNGQASYDFEFRIVRPDGEIRLCHSRGEVKYDPAGRPLKVIGTVHDVTEQRRMQREILEVSGREARRIGHDLHDTLGQQLTGIAFLAKAIATRLAEKGAPEASDVRTLERLANEAIAQARAISRGLNPVAIEEGGLGAALRELAADTEKTFDVTCAAFVEEAFSQPDENVAINLFGIAREAVLNSVKHGGATNIVITLSEQGGSTILAVEDDGVGISDRGSRTKGTGIRIMGHRADVINGSLTIERRLGSGTVVRCSCGIGDNAKERESTT